LSGLLPLADGIAEAIGGGGWWAAGLIAGIMWLWIVAGAWAAAARWGRDPLAWALVTAVMPPLFGTLLLVRRRPLDGSAARPAPPRGWGGPFLAGAVAAWAVAMAVPPATAIALAARVAVPPQAESPAAATGCATPSAAALLRRAWDAALDGAAAPGAAAPDVAGLRIHEVRVAESRTVVDRGGRRTCLMAIFLRDGTPAAVRLRLESPLGAPWAVSASVQEVRLAPGWAPTQPPGRPAPS